LAEQAAVRPYVYALPALGVIVRIEARQVGPELTREATRMTRGVLVPVAVGC
jgi:hypothetical protein